MSKVDNVAGPQTRPTGPVTLDEAFDLKTPPRGTAMLPDFCRGRLRTGEDYVPATALLDALRVALELRQPLLLTGDPGSGKTRLADFVAYRLQAGKPLTFRVKSTSTARDLFYAYDAIGRFNVRDGASNPLSFITYGPLGKAILFANPRSKVQSILPGTAEYDAHTEARVSVVLIDEIDKAPRDFPNDFLGELDEMRFSIPEIGHNAEIVAGDEFLPVVIVTSNSERDLPDAFLRRCVYYHIPFPDAGTLQKIVLARLKGLVPLDPGYVQEAVAVFVSIHERTDVLVKPPGTSELIEWLVAMQRLGGPTLQRFDLRDSVVQRTLGTLFKTPGDLEIGWKLMQHAAGG
jgi:MoxR-like ATPase